MANDSSDRDHAKGRRVARDESAKNLCQANNHNLDNANLALNPKPNLSHERGREGFCCRTMTRNRDDDDDLSMSEPIVERGSDNGPARECRHSCAGEQLSGLTRCRPQASCATTTFNRSHYSIARSSQWLRAAVACSAVLLWLSCAPGQSLSLDPTGPSVPPECIHSRTKCNYVDRFCYTPTKRSLTEAQAMLMMLECDVKPALLQYRELRQKMAEEGMALAPLSEREPAITSIAQLISSGGQSAARKVVDIEFEFTWLIDKIEHFAHEGLEIISMRDFCTFSTISRLARLKDASHGSELLRTAYDLVAIEFHEACLVEAISKLPAVPYLVRDVVKIYIDGADKPILPDLNDDPIDSQQDGGAADEQPFDIERAIRESGSLSDVVNLLIVMPGDGQNRVEEFRRSCKEFLIEIEQRWQSMEMMNQMLATDGNAIRQLNNYVVRKITPTKYADICSQLSARAN